ncbi:hypothetical protein TRFO_22858 [Tritrichomonas foetus]|uniref:Right handed beta helix domain-containing protein n=1 Tax=Tritrichomonas foetus TaxID=1144522 RepID=A0A1J4KAZ0_9EUKA|nr:hypothetical protein TRFO_22858 [Tritrichomonas foetus]|eukprot:OHT08591.1 hypothetical protein TRFO_22858 [Tritrichomonas foetus]
MLTLFFILSFRLHTTEELRNEENFGKFRNSQNMRKEYLVNKKSTKEAQFNCDPVDYAHESNSFYELPNNYASYIECNDQKLVLLGNRMVRVIQKAPQRTETALITLNNADLMCQITNWYACSVNSTKGGTFLFKGRGEHKIYNAEFNFCGIKGGPGQDCSVIYIEGNSTNEFNTVVFNTWENGSPIAKGPIPSGLDSIRAIWILGSATLQYDNPRAYNHTATKWGGFMRIDTTGLVILNGGGFDLPIKYCCDRDGVAGAIYKGSKSTNMTQIQNVYFFNCGPVPKAKNGNTACIYIDGDNFSFIKSEITFNSGDRWYQPVPCMAIYVEYQIIVRIQGNTIYNCPRGIKYNGKARTTSQENAQIDQNNFWGLTGQFEGVAIEATLANEKSTFNGNTFTNIRANKSWVKVQVSGITTPNYTVSNQRFSNFVTPDNGSVLDVKIPIEKTLVLNSCHFSGNQAVQNGGALHVNRPTVFISCTFTNNRATQKGGAISLQLTTGCSFQNCIFTNNTASAGGCIYISAPTSAGGTNDLTIVGCNFTGSTGGVAHCIYFEQINGQLKVTRCHFMNNKYSPSFKSGSCILSLASETVVMESHFSAENKQQSCGGVNVTRKSTLTVTGCSFTRMNAGNINKGGGGGIAYSGLIASNSDVESITITFCTFTDNTGINGVALLLQPTSDYPNITGCTFQDHQHTSAILTIFFQFNTDEDDYELTKCNFYRNSHNNSISDDMGATGIWIAESQALDQWQDACNLIFKDCIFEYNYAPSNGGAFAYGSNGRLGGVELTFDNCEFNFNECGKNYGGALMFRTQKPVYIIYCKFNGNIVRGGSRMTNQGGGAISFGSSVSYMTIYSCQFRNCSAPNASFIHSLGQSQSVEISKCIFTELPTRQLSSISIELSTGTDKEFIFENNEFNGLHCEGSYGSSGFRLVANKDCEIRNCLFQNCVFEINNRHETGMLAISGNSNHILTVDSCTFQITDDSITSDSARALFVRNEHGLNVANCTFQNFHTTTRTGAALKSESQTKSTPFYNCTFQNIKAYSLVHFEYCKEIDVEHCQFISVKTNCPQGIIYNAKAITYHLASCIFIECGGLYQGHQLINSGAIGVNSLAENVTIINCTFDTCQTIPPSGKTPNGGAVNLIGGKLKHVLISQCRFTKCRISGEGLAVYIGPSAHTELLDNIFENSIAHTTVNNNAQATFTVYVNTVKLIYQNNTILETGDFSGNGSGLCCPNAKSITIDSCLFSNLKRMYALRCISSDELIIENSTWDKISGGNSVCFFLDCTGSDPIFRNNTLKNHILIDSSNEQYLGFLRGKTQSRVENCTFDNNEARCQYGGGIGMWCPSKINYYINCIFRSNHAYCPVGTTDDGIGRGGAITLGGSLGNVRTIIQNCSFGNNRADKEGGAISVTLKKTQNSVCEITNCLFTSNQAAKQDFGNSTSNQALGGSIHISGDGLVTISGCSFSSNSAHEDGHAIYSQGDAQVLVTGNCTFRDNARIGGSQIAVSGTNFEFTDSTITLSTDSPRARAFTILSEGSIDLHNSTLHDMTAPSDGNGNAIYIKRGAGNVEIYNNIFRNCGFGATINKKDVSTIPAILCNGTNLELQENKFFFNMSGIGKRSPCVEIITTGSHHIHGNHFQNSAKAFIYRALQIGDAEPELVVDHNNFTRCYGASPSCLLVESYHTFEFNENNFSHANPTSRDHFYIIAIDFFAHLDGDTFVLSNNYFGNLNGNDAFGGGSGIWIDNKDVPVYKLFTVRFENCVFENNHAKHLANLGTRNGHNGHGGAFQFGWSESTAWVNLELDNCSFKGNKADKEGGAVSIQTTGTVSIENCVFENNHANVLDSKAKFCGGALFLEPDFNWDTAHNVNGVERYSDSIIIANCSFSNNDAFNSSAIYCLGGKRNTTLTITQNCSFTDNGNSGCAIISGAKELLMDSSSIEYSTKKARGMETDGKTTLTNVKFRNNQNTDGKGNALYIARDSELIEIHSCLFESCGSGKSETTIICKSAPLLLEGTTFNYSTKLLGARAIEVLVWGLIQIVNNYFSHTTTDASHGALFYNPTIGTYTQEDLVIEGNIFNDSHGDNSRCFRIYLHTPNYRFYGNKIQNCISTGRRGYLGFVEGVNGILNNFTFDHFTIENCTTSSEYGGGSGLWVQNARNVFDLIFDSCVFSNNKAISPRNHSRQGYGGAIQYGWSDTTSKVYMRFSNCTFNKNFAQYGGGAIALETQNNVVIENCTFSHNQAGDSNHTKVCGGAIFINPNYGKGESVSNHNVMDTIAIIGCNFTKDFAYSGFGNGIYVPNAKTTNVFINTRCIFDRVRDARESTTILVTAKLLEIDNITVSYEPVSNNRHARAIQTDSETVSILHSVFTNCGHNSQNGHAINLLEQVQSANIDSCHFTDCAYSNNSNAVIHSSTKDITLSSSVIEFSQQNQVSRGLMVPFVCTLNLNGVTFKGCGTTFTGRTGGALQYDGVSKVGYVEEIIIEGCIFDNNTCPYASSIMITCNSIPILKDCTISKNKGGWKFVLLFKEAHRQEVIFEEWKFDDNYFNNPGNTPDCGGCGLWIAPMQYSARFKDSWSLTFQKCKWSKNRANQVGGAFAYGYSDTLRYVYVNITGCLFENNTCDGEKGGALSFNSQVQVLITKSEFRGNEAKNGTHQGHALYVDARCHALVNGCKFIDNSQSGTNSVIQVSGKRLDFVKSEISFTTNKGCRGIFMNQAGILNCTNSSFSKCNAGNEWGGGIFFNLSTPSLIEEEISIIGCKFDGNIAGNGCAMLLNTSIVPTLQSNQVYNHNTGKYILSIFFTSFQDICFVESMEFYNNVATQANDGGGSGIWIANQREISNGRPAELIFRNCTWGNNTTPNKGGALHYGDSETLVGVELTFDNCNFINNHAKTAGGAVSLATESPIVFNECKFSNNLVTSKDSKTKARGSSIIIDSNRDTSTPLVSISGCTFTNETADDGNAIYVTYKVPACFISGCNFKNCGTTGTVVVLEAQEILFQNNDVIFDRIEKACRGLEIRSIAVTTVTKSVFQKCHVAGSLSDKTTWGAGIYLNNTLQSEEQEDFTMEECTFDACKASNGCAILLNVSASPVIRTTMVKNHRSGDYVFCIFCNVNFQDLFTIESCTFYNNQFQNTNKQDGGGSGIWISNDQNLLPGTPTKILYKGCNWTRNSGVYGGAFSYGTSNTVKNTELVFQGCHFENNQASGAMGGALYLTTEQPIYVDNCRFINNKVLNNINKGGEALGGAITFDTTVSTCTIVGSTFRKNSAQNGHALYVSPTVKYVELIDSHFLSNSNGNVGSQILHKGIEVHSTNSNFDFEAITLHARGFEILSKSISTFTNCNFTLCETSGPGGGLHIADSSSSSNTEQLTLDGCIFDSCDASNGAALLCWISCNPTISRCIVKNMKKGNYAFSMFFTQFQEYVTIDECTFQDILLHNHNTTTKDGGGSGLWVSSKKELHNGTSSKLTFNKCNFINNIAGGVGGAIAYGDSQTLKATSIQFLECLFEGNTANGAQGGAIWFRSSESLIVSKCKFRNNKVNGGYSKGGHIYVDSEAKDSIQISGSTFDPVNANAGNAIYSGDNTKVIAIYNVTFNHCGTQGSVISSSAEDFSLSTSKIIFTQSVDSKSARGVDILRKGKATITQTDFINCYSSGPGAGIQVTFTTNDSRNESLSITDCTFDSCNATNGCAMLLKLTDAPTIYGNTIKNCNSGNYVVSILYAKFVQHSLVENCIFQNNYLGVKTSPDGGGSGIWIAPDEGIADSQIKYLTFRNCTFNGNSAAGSGGGFAYGINKTVTHTAISLENSRFYSNTAGGDGGALYIRTNQPLSITRCIFDNNTASSSGGALYIDTDSNVTVEHSQISHNTATQKSSGIYINNSHYLNLYNDTIASNAASSNSNLAASFFLNNEGKAVIDQCKFDFTRQTSQYQIGLSGTSSEATITFIKGCFTHKGTTDETLTHILSTVKGTLNIPSGNCFDTPESFGVQHGGGKIFKGVSIFNCDDCKDIHVPTTVPDDTSSETFIPTGQPSTDISSTSPSSVPDDTSSETFIPTGQPSTDISSTSPSSVPDDTSSETFIPTGQPSTDISSTSPSSVPTQISPSDVISETSPIVDDRTPRPINLKKIGIIAGIAISAVVAIVVIIVILWLLVFRDRGLAQKSDSENASEMNDETISGISGIDATQDDPIWAGTTATQDNPLFNGGDELDYDEQMMIENDFEESWGDNVI